MEEFREADEPFAFYNPPTEDGSRPGIYYINAYDLPDRALHHVTAFDPESPTKPLGVMYWHPGTGEIKGKVRYLVKWIGWPSEYNQWVPEEEMNAQRLIDSFEKSRRGKRLHKGQERQNKRALKGTSKRRK